jgi:hypothetical protein
VIFDVIIEDWDNDDWSHRGLQGYAFLSLRLGLQQKKKEEEEKRLNDSLPEIVGSELNMVIAGRGVIMHIICY